MRHIIRGINPVPWKAPSVGWINVRGKRIPKLYAHAEMVTYKEAVKEALAGSQMLDAAELHLRFYFFRHAGTKHDHVADATNLQKATEDALQGVLFPNDRAVRRVESWIVAQGAEVSPLIVVELEELEEEAKEIPPWLDDIVKETPFSPQPEPGFDVEELF